MKKIYEKIRPLLTVTLVLLILWLTFIIAAPKTFLSRYIYISFMSSIPLIAIIASGITLVIILGEIDMSFAANMAVSGFVFAIVSKTTGSPLLAFFLALSAGAGIGLLNGIVIAKTGAPAIVVTIGFDFLWRGAVMLLSNGLAVSLAEFRPAAAIAAFTGRIGGVIPAQSLWAIAVSICFAVILHRTAFGDAIKFIGDNRAVAKMMGLPVSLTRIGVFALSGCTAAFSSVISCMEFGSWWPTQGEGYLLLVFASVFLGGTSIHGGKGTLWGSLAGAVVIGMIEAGLVSAGISGFWTRFIHGLILIFSIVFYTMSAKSSRRKNGSF